MSITLGIPSDPQTMECEWCGVTASKVIELRKNKSSKWGKAEYIYTCSTHESHAKRALGLEEERG